MGEAFKFWIAKALAEVAVGVVVIAILALGCFVWATVEVRREKNRGSR